MNFKNYANALSLCALFIFSFTQTNAQCLLTSVSTTGGATEVTTCPGDGDDDVVKFKPNTWAAGYVWVVTDANNIIIDHFWGNKYNFENGVPGTCRVWGVSNSGFVTVPTGENIFDGDFQSFCWIISVNFVTINKIVPDGGNVSLSNGDTETYLCPGDGNPDVLSFSNDSQAANNYAYIITDNNGIILDSTDDEYDFDGFPFGTCRVYGVGYTDNFTVLVGEDINNTVLSDGCYDLSDNFVSVTKDEPNGGNVARPDGSTFAHVCVGNGVSNVIGFESFNTSNLFYAYVIADENDNFWAIEYGDYLDFETAPVGTCRIYGMAFVGNVIISIGENIFSNAITDDCYDLSDNYIEVLRSEPNGSFVSLDDGTTQIFTCPGDGVADIVNFSTSSGSTANYTFAVTDENGEILALPTGNSFDFEGAPAGICRIYGISYVKDFLGQTGFNINQAILADDCWEISENYIEVVRETPNGGTISTPSGDDLLYSCADGNPDVIQFVTTGVSNSNTVFVITDENKMVVNIVNAGNDSFDFNNAAIGNYRVYSVAYTGDFILIEGQFLGDDDVSDDCFDISSNYITVIRDEARAGSVSTVSGNNPVYTCPGDGKADVIAFQNQGASNLKYAYLILDINFLVVDIITGDSYDFDGLGEGISAVLGVSYSGSLTIQPGEDPFVTAISDDCFEMSSDWVDVFHMTPEGGSLFTISAESEVDVCAGDGTPDLVIFAAPGAANIPYFYVITDESNEILEFGPVNLKDFDQVDEGICRVWGVSFTGNFTGIVGENLDDILLSDDCYDISDTFIEVRRTFVEGGDVATNLGEDQIYLCPGDGNPNLIDFTTTSDASTNNYTYIITDNQNVITNILTEDFYDFENDGIGINQVWGVSYSGNLLAQVGDDISQATLSDACYALSNNSIEVIRDLPNGDVIVSNQGDVVDICVNDDQEDVIAFITGSFSFAQYQFIVTDENNEILEVMDDILFDFEDFSGGVCRVWGLSYTGHLTIQPGDIAGLDPLSDDCFELSSNYIEINKTEVDAATIFSPSGSELFICVGDGVPNFVGFFNTTSLNNDYRYLITDENGILLDVIGFNLYNFEDSNPGTCHVYGLDMTGVLSIFQGQNIFTTALSTECYALSSNFITVHKSIPDAGTIATDDGQTSVTVEVNDGIADIVNFVTTDVSNSKFQFVVTDDNNEILGFFDDPSFDFEGAGEGVCRVWGIAYTGGLLAETGDILTDVAISNQCSDLSDNFVEIIRDDPNNLITPGSNADGGITITQAQPFGKLILAPNPASDHLRINFQSIDFEGISQVQVLNLAGQVVYESKLETFEGQNEFNVEVGNWSAGTYYLVLKNENGSIRNVFVKQ